MDGRAGAGGGVAGHESMSESGVEACESGMTFSGGMAGGDAGAAGAAAGCGWSAGPDAAIVLAEMLLEIASRTSSTLSTRPAQSKARRTLTWSIRLAAAA